MGDASGPPPAVTYDVCVVGAGPAGLVLAHELTARGLTIAVVDAGPARPVRARSRVETVIDDHRGVNEARAWGLGGTSELWGGQLWAWDDAEFAARPHLDRPGWLLPQGWLEQPLHRVEKLLGIDLADVPPPAPALTQLEARTGTRHKHSSWLGRGRRLRTTLGASLRGRERVDVLLETSVTGWSEPGEAGEPGEGGGATTRVDLLGADGRRSHLSARVLVLAAGTLANIELLARHPGTGELPWLGRGIMDHVSRRVAAVDVRDWRRFRQVAEPVYRAGRLRTVKHLPDPAFLAAHRLPDCYVHWEVEDPVRVLYRRTLRRERRATGEAAGSGPLAALVVRAAAGVAVMALARVLLRRRRILRGSRVHLRLDVEQLSEAEQRVVVDPDESVPTRLEWTVGDDAHRTWKVVGDDLLDRWNGLGLMDLRPATSEPVDVYHLMGGTRMSADATSGVVDADGRVHGSRRTYVLGASTFPSGGVANPTTTAMALAVRMAAHLAGELQP